MALFAHLLNYSSYDIIRGANIEAEFDNYDSIINTLIQYGGAPVANITALRALVTAAYYVGASPDKPITDGQIKVVQAVSDGTNTTIGIYEFKAGDATSDTDGGSNVDTDGIVAPTQSGMGRWFRVATTNMITNRGVVALRTMFNALNIDLNTDSVAADAFLVLTKRAAASQVKILTNEQVAIRNLADSAYEDFAALSGTFAGAVSGTTGTFSGAVSGTTGTFSSAVSGTTGTFSGAVSGTTGTFTGAVSIGGNLDCNSNKLTEVANATVSTDAPNLGQVELLISTSAPFAPSTFDHLVLWFDANRLAGLADAASVSAWKDFSGQANNVAQGTGANQPIFKSAIQNSKDVVRFDGTNDYILAAGPVLVSSKPFTCFLVVKQSSASNTKIVSVGGGGVGNDTIAFTNANEVQYLATTGSTYQYAHGVTAGNFCYVTITCNATSGANGTVDFRINGVNVGTTASIARSYTTADFFTIGAYSTGITPWNGDIGEVIIYEKAMGTTERDTVESYLATKWGL